MRAPSIAIGVVDRVVQVAAGSCTATIYFGVCVVAQLILTSIIYGEGRWEEREREGCGGVFDCCGTRTAVLRGDLVSVVLKAR